MGDSIIYVGSRNMSREDRYYSKDNWGMYKKPKTIKQDIGEKDSNVYKYLTILGRRTPFINPEQQTDFILELRNKKGKKGPSNKIARKTLCAYKRSYKNEKNATKREQLIRKNLDFYLAVHDIPLSIQDKLKKQDKAFNPKKNVSNKSNKKVKGKTPTKQDDFYINLCNISRRVIPRQKQSKEATKLLAAYDNKISTLKTVLAVFNSYYLCCHGYTDKKDKNKRIKKTLEKYLIMNKVDVRIRRRILEIEGS